MGKINQGILCGFSGKVGSVVGAMEQFKVSEAISVPHPLKLPRVMFVPENYRK